METEPNFVRDIPRRDTLQAKSQRGRWGGDGGEVDIYIFIICHFICESRLWYALVTQVRYEGIAELYL